MGENLACLTEVKTVIQGSMRFVCFVRKIPLLSLKHNIAAIYSFNQFCHKKLASHRLIQGASEQLLSVQAGGPANLAVVNTSRLSVEPKSN